MKDFFISYTKADQPWAEWIAWQLESEGYTTVIQAWDFHAGSNFVSDMQRATKETDRTIAVLSSAFLASSYTEAEWTSAFARDPKGAERRLILVRVEEIEPPGLLKPIVYIDLVNVKENDASKLLLKHIRAERAKPDKSPNFPGFSKRFDSSGPIFPSKLSTIGSLSAELQTRQQLIPRLYNVPYLPEHHQPQREHLELIKNIVLSASNVVGITGSTRRTGLLGMGGIGKTVLAITIARNPEVQSLFPDGIIWLTFGRQVDVVLQQLNFAQALGEQSIAITNWQDGRAKLSRITAEKACLVILDDVWEPWQAEAFSRIGNHCCLVVTTRNRGVIQKISAQEHRLNILSEQDACNFLIESACLGQQPIPFEVYDVARQCGYLPLALAVVGALIRTQRYTLKEVRDLIEVADIKRLRANLPECEHEGVLAALEVSIEALPGPTKLAFIDCAVFPEDVAIPETVLVTLWSDRFSDPEDARDVAQQLFERSVIDRDDSRLYRIHDLYHDYLKVRIKDLVSAHRRLIDGYGKKRRNGWSTVTSDDYFFQFFPRHLRCSGNYRTLFSLLCDPNWIENKIKNTNVYSLIADYDLLLDFRETAEVSDGIQTTDLDELQVIQDALRLSSTALTRSPEQVKAQLWARVFFKTANRNSLFLKSLFDKPIVWLRLMTPSVNLPGGQLIWELVGHQEGVLSIAVNPHRNLAITGSQDSTIKIWDLTTGGELKTLSGHSHSVYSVAVTPDGRRVLSASVDGTARVWDIANGQELQCFSGHNDKVLVIAPSPDGRTAATADKNGVIKSWELESGREISSFVGHSDRVWKLLFSMDGTRLLSSSSDNTMRIWDLETSTELCKRHGDQGPNGDTVAAVLAISSDGKNVISASDETTLCFWPLNDPFQPGVPLIGHTQLINDVAITPNGKRAVSCSDDATVRVWDMTTFNEVGAFQHAHEVTSVDVSPDGKKILSGSWDSSVKVWDMAAAAQNSPSLICHAAYINLVKVSSDGRLAASASDDCTIRVWDFSTADCISVLKGHTEPIWDIAFTEQGQLVSASWDTTIKIWDIPKGELSQTLKGHTEAIYTVRLSFDGRSIYSGSADQTIRMWDFAGRNNKTFNAHNNRIWDLAVIANSDQVFSSSWDKTIKAWDVAAGAVKKTFYTGACYPTVIAVSHDCKFLVSALGTPRRVFDLAENTISPREAQSLKRDLGDTGLTEEWYTWKEIDKFLTSEENGVRVWDLKSGNLVAKLYSGDKPVEALALSQNPTRVLYASGNTIYVADPEDDSQIRTLEGHFDYITAIDVAADNNTAISVAKDNSIRLWDFKLGVCLASFTADAPLTSCRFSPNANKIVVGDEAGNIHFFNVEKSVSKFPVYKRRIIR